MTKWGDTEIIWELDPGGGYDWAIASVIRRGEPGSYEYALYTDSGCSCNNPYEEGPEYYDLDWDANPQVLAGRARIWIDGSYDLTADEKVTKKAELTMFLKNERYKNV